MTTRAYDMKRPCINCPFRTDDTAIRFANRERAVEIEESAYRYGFPCHVTAHHDEDGNCGGGAFVFGRGSQHCVGYIIMQLKASDTGWPGIGNDGVLRDSMAEQVDWDAPVFDSADDFYAANDRAK